jgi:toxin YoeB
MMYTIRVSDGVDKVIAKWKKSNPNLFKKYKKIYKELLEHPKTGLGHLGGRGALQR